MSPVNKLVWFIEEMDLPDHVNAVCVDAGNRQYILQIGRGHVLGAGFLLESWLSGEEGVLVHPESSKYGRMAAGRLFF